MAHKCSLEAFRITKPDLKGNKKHFGDTALMESNYYRQTSLIIPHYTFFCLNNYACLKQFSWTSQNNLIINMNNYKLLNHRNA